MCYTEKQHEFWKKDKQWSVRNRGITYYEKKRDLRADGGSGLTDSPSIAEGLYGAARNSGGNGGG